MPCSVIVAFNPQGSPAEDNDYIRCGQAPAKRGPMGLMICKEHEELFKPNV